MNTLFEKLYKGQNLTSPESGKLFTKIMEGELCQSQLASLLIALKIKGETPDEIAGAALALRQHAEPFNAPNYLYADSCGTGGDNSSTINISTASAFIAAEAGLPIIKHGNRSVTSNCGSADVLEKLGAKIDIPPEEARQCLDEVGVTFLFAPKYHKGFKHAVPVRRSLATRTIFNCLGPLVNPARPPIQLMGVYDPMLCRPIAETLKLLGTKNALVVHGSGLDEIATHDKTTACQLRDGKISKLTLTPEKLGISRHSIDDLKGGNPKENARLLKQILSGEAPLALVDVVAVNTGPLLFLADMAPSLKAGVAVAKNIIIKGSALSRLNHFIRATNRLKKAA